MWESLIKYYDNLEKNNKPVCPIAHTYISAHIGVLIDKAGNFLVAMAPEVRGELATVPCTVESEGRTSNIAPHLLSDQLQYVGIVPGQEEKHKAYIAQLQGYVQKNPDDIYASAVYAYVSKETIMDDIADIIKDYFNIRQTNVIFAVYGLEDTNGADKMWTDYYVKTLPINGICSVTGKPDYIPDSFPPGIFSSGDKGRLFLNRDNPLDLRPKAAPGYIASQKIIHALQYMLYGARNVEETEAKYKMLDYSRGDISRDELKDWVDKNYPGKWDGFISILESQTKNS